MSSDTTVTVAVAQKPAVLTVINPSGQRSRSVLNRSPFLVGRQSDNHLILRDNRVSRIHARITCEGGDYYLEDLQSRHGTFINGEKVVTRRRLNHSDTIHFGFADGYQLIFLQEDKELSRLVDQVASSSQLTNATGALGKLRALVEVARALQSSLSIHEVLESVVEAALNITRSDRGFLLLKRGHELTVEVARDAAGNSLHAEDLRVPTTLIQRALNSRKDLLSMHFDPYLEGSEEPDLSVQKLDLRSVVCIPLVKVKTDTAEHTIAATAKDTVGMLYLDSKVDVADLSAGNREILQTLALEASTVIENARLLDQERARQRLDEELRIAREIQRTLLPKTLPSAGWFRVAASTIPSQQVGGDYYDVAPINSATYALVVADVSGKGVSSGLLASLLQGAFLTAPELPADIRSLMDRLNRYLHERTEGEKYATLFYATITSEGRIHWINAAHCTPVLLHRDGLMESFDSTSMPVGLLAEVAFDVRTTQLQPGDKLVIFSDGFTDAHNSQGEFLDTRRIREMLRGGGVLDAQSLHSALLDSLHGFTGGSAQRDDMTLVVAEFQNSG